MCSKAFLASLFLLSHLYPLFAFNKFISRLPGNANSKGYGRLPEFEDGKSVASSEEVSSSSQSSQLGSRRKQPSLPQPSYNNIDVEDPNTAVYYRNLIYNDLGVWIQPQIQFSEPHDIPFREKYIDDNPVILKLKATFDAAKKKKKAPNQLSNEMRRNIDAVLKGLSPRGDEQTYETDLRIAHHIQYLCLLSSSENTQLSDLIRIYVGAKLANNPYKPAARMRDEMNRYLVQMLRQVSDSPGTRV